MLKPVWTYCDQFCGCTKMSNVPMIRFQNRLLRNIVLRTRKYSLYIRNSDLHRDLDISFVISEIQIFSRKREDIVHHHENVEVNLATLTQRKHGAKA